MPIPFHPYADIFPLIQGEEFAGLVADIKANGLREKIIVLDGSILDGRNRYRAAVAAEIASDGDLPDDRPVLFQRFVPAVDGDALKFVISKNLHRRHLDDRQRASVAAKIANLSRGGEQGKPPIGGLTAGQAAAALNVAPRQVERARVVHDLGVPEVRDALDRGDVAVSAAEQIARMPEAEQPQALANVLPSGHRAHMASRIEPDDSLDFLPTPPWGTRALMERIFPHLGIDTAPGALGSVWEPACGEGHMAEVLVEYFPDVTPTDVFDYGYSREDLTNFIEEDLSFFEADWIISNPPFGDKAEQFTLRALELAKVGVAMFVPLRWLETVGRYERLFLSQPPTLISFFVERVNLCKGEWKPDGSTATAYIWLVWIKGRQPQAPFWIPPGCRESLTRPDDAARFTAHPVIRKENLDRAAGEATEAA